MTRTSAIPSGKLCMMAKNKADAEPVLYANTSNAAGAEPFLPGTLLSTDAASNTARVQPATGGAPLKLPGYALVSIALGPDLGQRLLGGGLGVLRGLLRERRRERGRVGARQW